MVFFFFSNRLTKHSSLGQMNLSTHNLKTKKVRITKFLRLYATHDSHFWLILTRLRLNLGTFSRVTSILDFEHSSTYISLSLQKLGNFAVSAKLHFNSLNTKMISAI